MTENIISWNVANWVSVVIMALVGFAILSFVANFINKSKEVSK